MSKSKKDILNFYDVMPDQFKLRSDNPNYAIHNLNIPFRMCIVAPSGSGKSNFIMNLINKFSEGEGTFDSIQIVTRDKDEPLYNYLVFQSKGQIVITEGLHTIPDLDKFDKEYNHLLIFDDLVMEKNLNKISEYFIRCRKKNVSACFLSQSYYAIPKMIRLNSNYLVILKMNSHKDRNLILREVAQIDGELLKRIYDYCTEEKFVPLIIDMSTSDMNKKFRKGFLEYIEL